MKFTLTGEQRQFGATLHELLAKAEVPAAARAWATGDHGPGLAIWRALSDAGVTGLAVPEAFGGLGAQPVDLVVACEELGHHPVPGPLAESIAAVPRLLAESIAAAPRLLADAAGDFGSWLADLSRGELIATLARPPQLPYALDADLAGLVLLADAGTVTRAVPGVALASMDPARHLFELSPGEPIAAGAQEAIAAGLTWGTLASAALLLGAGQGALELTVRHAKAREQFGRPIGAFQAVKHQLADVAIRLAFARPLLYAAALAVGATAPTAARDVSAARVACADASRLAVRTALQVHGAIGYTRESDLSLWLAKVRALASTWGSQAEHRAVVLAALSEPETGPWN